MRTRDAFGLTMAPLFLRIMLAAVFLFAGLTKVTQTMDLPPDQAAYLANLGVIDAPATPAPKLKPDPKLAPLPDPDASPVTPPATPATTPPTGESPASTPTGGLPPMARVLTLAMQPESTTPEPAPTSATTPTPDLSPATSTPTAPERVYTAADFPNGAKVKPGLMIAMMIDGAAHPAPNADGTTPMPLWPDRLAQKPWPLALAWAATLTEIIAAALLVIGLFTRFSALGLASTMAVAMWLTQIGPAIQSGNTVLGFLPNYALMSPDWQTLFLQFSLFAAAMALACMGAGAASLDAAIFGSPSASARPAPRPRKPVLDD